MDKALVAAWAIRDEELEQAQAERDQWKAAYDAWAALLGRLLAGLLEYVSTRPEDEADAVALVPAGRSKCKLAGTRSAESDPTPSAASST